MRIAIAFLALCISMTLVLALQFRSVSTNPIDKPGNNVEDSAVRLEISKMDEPKIERVLEKVLSSFHAAREKYAEVPIDNEVANMAVRYLGLLRVAEMNEEFEASAQLLQPYLTGGVSVEEIKAFPQHPPRHPFIPDAKLSDDNLLSTMNGRYSVDFSFEWIECLSESETLHNILETNQPDLDAVMPAVEALLESPFWDKYTVGKVCAYAVMLSVAGRSEEADKVYALAVQLAFDLELFSYQHFGFEEPLLWSDELWACLFRAQVRMQKYDDALASLEKMRETYIKIYEKGLKIEWHGTWDKCIKYMIQSLCYEGDIERGLALIEKLTVNTSHEAKRLLPDMIASRFAQFGQEEMMRKVLETCHLNEEQEFRCYYQLAKYQYKQGQTQEAHAAFKRLLEDYHLLENYHSNDAYFCDEWGLIFLKLGDTENAKKLFARVDEQITRQFEDTPEHMESRARGNYYLLMDRFKSGLRQEAVDVVLSVEEPWYAVPLTLYFLDSIADFADQQTCQQLIEHANRMAAQIPPNPGIVKPLYEMNMSTYRNNALWWIARSALRAGCIDEFQTAVLAAEDLDAAIPKMEDEVPTRSHGEISFTLRQYSQWSECCQHLAERGHFDRALLAADRLTEPFAQFDAYFTIAYEMCWQQRMPEIRVTPDN